MAIWNITCGHCGKGVAAHVVSGWPQSRGNASAATLAAQAQSSTLWLQCPNCGEGSVKLKTGGVYPTAPAGGTVKNLPPDVEQAWREARVAHAVAAYTAAEMMCRKILMHLSVDVASAAAGKSFVEYVDALENAGYLAKGTKPTVDKIRSRGNIANHELPASSEEESLITLVITEHLLRSVYEIPAL